MLVVGCKLSHGNHTAACLPQGVTHCLLLLLRNHLQTNRKGTPLLRARPGTGSFPAADRYEGSYIEAFAKTIHSPGPIYYPSNAFCGCDSGATVNGSSDGSRGTARTTARCSHSAAGTWAKADVGSREHMLVHSFSCGSPQHLPSCQLPSTTSQQLLVSAAAGEAARCAACDAARGSVPGPGSYDVPVGRDGRGLLLAQSCPAFSVPKARRLLAGR
jgi:hypothetical protein